MELQELESATARGGRLAARLDTARSLRWWLLELFLLSLN